MVEKKAMRRSGNLGCIKPGRDLEQAIQSWAGQHGFWPESHVHMA